MNEAKVPMIWTNEINWKFLFHPNCEHLRTFWNCVLVNMTFLSRTDLLFPSSLWVLLAMCSWHFHTNGHHRRHVEPFTNHENALPPAGQVVQQQGLAHHQHHQQPHQVVVQPQHVQQHQNVVVSNAQSKPKTHFCPSCGKGFAAKHGILQHNRRHPNGSCTLRSHVCECGKAFFQKNHLMLHQRQHLETKPSVAALQQATGQSQVN